MEFIPVIFGGHVNGYSIARTFFETYGIKSIICDYIKHVSRHSSFVDYRFVPNPKHVNEFVEYVFELGAKLRENGKQPLIIVTNDIWLIPLSRNRDILDKRFIYSFSRWDVIERLTIKNNLYSLADSLGVLYPKTRLVGNVSDIVRLNELRFPILIKPVEVVEFIEKFSKRKRNRVFNSNDTLTAYLEDIFKVGFNSELVAQEYIPSGIENLYTATTYSDQSGMVRGVSVGHKLTQYPPEAGTITSGLISYVKEVEDLSKKLLESVKFFGIANTEFKYDERDGKYYLMEVNPRPGMWNYSSYVSGLNLFEMLVVDLSGRLNKNAEIVRGKSPWLWTVASMFSVKKMLSEAMRAKIKDVKIINPMNCEIESIKYRITLAIQSSFVVRGFLKIIKKFFNI